MTAIKEQFDLAVTQVKNTPASKPATPETQLKMYGLFKQANEGDVKGSKPSMLNPVARAKFKAWDELKGMKPEDAMKAYIGEVESILGTTPQT